MPESLEDIPTMTATQRLIEVLRSEQRGMWQKVDATFDAVNDHGDDERLGAESLYEDKGDKNTGLHRRISEVWGELFDAHVPEQPEQKTVQRWYAVARAWPEETRVEGASYYAHSELASKQWTNRQGALSRLVAETRKRHQDPEATVSGDQVRLWKQAQLAKSETKPWEDKFWSRLDSLVHSRIGPKSKGEWETAISLVKTLLDDMREEAENAK